MRIRPRSTFAHWPFWLLIVAWFCANIPSLATVQLLTWIKGAEHFSHYAGLRQSVACLLAGQPRVMAAKLATGDAAPVRHPLPSSIPAEGGLKKIDFDPSTGSLRLIASLQAEARLVCDIHAPEAPVVEIPYPPPRIRGLA